MKKLITIILITLLLSSCAMLDRLWGNPNPHANTPIEVPIVTEDIVVPTVVANDIRG